jgi:hypothetical protein
VLFILLFSFFSQGAGTTRENGNQRMNLVSTMSDWESSKTNDVQGHKLLDAKGTGWNVRDKMHNGEIVHPRNDHSSHNFQSGRFNFVPIYEQSEYKYIIYADGHSAANRYAFLMRLGCVVLRVASRRDHTAGHDMWFYPILRAFDPFSSTSSPLVSHTTSLLECHDHILIDENLENLRSVLEWCRANDDICRQLAENATKKHAHYLSRDGILDYLETTMVDIAARRNGSTAGGPFWWQENGKSRPLPIPSMSSSGEMDWGKMTAEEVQLAGDDTRIGGVGGDNRLHRVLTSSSSSSSASSASSVSSVSSASSLPVARKRKAQQLDPKKLAALAKRRKN